ncbi:MAG: alanine racemase, partial [Bacteroidales bacterium]
NFVFYDLFQHSIGSCSENEIAVAMACPVVSKYPRDRRLLIHGGAVHFSKEVLELDGRTVFGKGVAYLSYISQEHGIIRDCPSGVFERIRIGDLLYLSPVHSCLTANLMGGYVTPEGKKIQMQPRPE